MNKRKKGSIYEEKTRQYLSSIGHEILNMNYQCRFGEIDIVTKDENSLVFIEVKYRRSRSHGHGSEAVNYHKRTHIIQVAKWYVMEHNLHSVPVRFDVAVWEHDDLKYYKGAFESYG